MDDTKASLLLSRKLPGGPSVFPRIRSKIREAIPAHILLSSLQSKDTFESGNIPLKIFVLVLNSLGVIFDEQEVEYLNRCYVNYRKELDYQKFYKALDIAIPSGFSDLDTFFDRLPQPYRFITKIFQVNGIIEAFVFISFCILLV